jgi:16S rRNA (cytidine1402-2'-O)-methyltransferase
MTDHVGKLFIVSTPIGNLADITHRAVEILKSVQLILAEDTRHSRVLLNHYAIATQLSSYHEHNEAKATPGLVKRLLEGEELALIADAGTPLLSDPGQRLVNAAIEAGIAIVPVPGASAMLAAIVASGLPADRFTFFGFLPRKGKERKQALDEIASSRWTAILYEAPSRVAETLRELADRAADRPVVVARELTKQFEELRRGTVAELGAYYSDTPPRGEVVIVIAGAPAAAVDERALEEEARSLRANGMSVRDVATVLAKRGVARNVAYRMAQGEGRREKGEGREEE